MNFTGRSMNFTGRVGSWVATHAPPCSITARCQHWTRCARGVWPISWSQCSYSCMAERRLPEPQPEPEPEAEPTTARRSYGRVRDVPANAQTSDSHPIRVSWITDSQQGDAEDSGPARFSARPGQLGGRLGLCFCPGKQIMNSRLRAGHEESGRPIMRDLMQDLQRLHSMGTRQCETPPGGGASLRSSTAAVAPLRCCTRPLVQAPDPSMHAGLSACSTSPSCAAWASK